MRLIRVLATLPLWFLLVAISPAATPTSPTPAASPSNPPTPSTAPSPPPTPTPVNAFLTLDVTAGGADTAITVNGSSFLANEGLTLYWDPPSNKVAGGAQADGSGNFTTRVKPFPGDTPGIHHLCASVPPNPCANFALQGPPTPTPSASPSPADSPSPSPAATFSPSDSPSPSPVAGTLSGLDVISKPPFVFLPIIGGLGILGAAAYWWLSVTRRPKPPTLTAASVVHRATRPDYRADFGTPPPAPAAPARAPSAWADVLPAATPPPPGAAAEPPVEAEPASAELPSAPDEPPELPEPGE